MTAAAGSTLLVPSGEIELEGNLDVPRDATGVVLFAHGSGSSRHSPRNTFVARKLNEERLATLLIDLLTPEEDANYETRFDIELLTRRLAGAARYLAREPRTAKLGLGLFGASTGAAAALRVASGMPEAVSAIVSRGGRPDLAGEQALKRVKAPALFIVGGRDLGVIELNEQAFAQLDCVKQLSIVQGATHLFEERGALDEVAGLAARWFARHLTPQR